MSISLLAVTVVSLLTSRYHVVGMIVWWDGMTPESTDSLFPLMYCGVIYLHPRYDHDKSVASHSTAAEDNPSSQVLSCAYVSVNRCSNYLRILLTASNW